MRMLGDLRIRTRVLAILVSALLLSLLLGGAALWGIGSLRRNLDHVSNRQFPGTVLLAEMGGELEMAARSVNVLLVRDTATDQVLRATNHELIGESLRKVAGLHGKLLALHPEYRDQESFQKMENAVEVWRRSVVATQAAAREWEGIVFSGVALDSVPSNLAFMPAFATWSVQRKLLKEAEATLDELKKQTAGEVAAAQRAGALAERTASGVVFAVLLCGAVLLLTTSLVLLRSIAEIIERLVGASGRLTEAVLRGELGVRADPLAVTAEFRPVVEGINKTVDAFVKPIEVTADYVHQIARGAIPPMIVEEYPGDFNALKENLNHCIRAVNQLKDREVQLSLAQEVALVGNCVLEVATGSASWSAELHRLVGVPPDARDPTHALFMERVHPDDRAAVQVALDHALEGRGSLELDFRIVRCDEAVCFVHGRGQVITAGDGRPLRVMLTLQDITERKELQARLVLAERMASLGTLAGGVAHEINNPLAFILSNLSFVADELSRLTPPGAELQLAIRDAQDGAVRVRDIVQGLKAFSRPDEPCNQTVDVREVLRSTMKLAQNEIRHRARLVVDLGEVPPVAGSVNRLGQVFVNLLVNAAQAIPEGHAERNEIRVSARMSEDGRVLVEISDTGRGIPRDILPRVFEPFFTTKPVGVGTGLGLSICHGIVTGLGGEIRAESWPEKGTTFRVFLPLASAVCVAAPVALQPPPGGAPLRGRVLVIDDEEGVGRVIQRILAGTYVVMTDTSAAAALARLRCDPGFDVILCDLMMPEMTGMELHDEILRTAPELAERLVFLTGGAFTDRARSFLERVPNARLEKPFDANALRSLVGERVVHRAPPARSSAAAAAGS